MNKRRCWLHDLSPGDLVLLTQRRDLLNGTPVSIVRIDTLRVYVSYQGSELGFLKRSGYQDQFRQPLSLLLLPYREDYASTADTERLKNKLREVFDAFPIGLLTAEEVIDWLLHFEQEKVRLLQRKYTHYGSTFHSLLGGRTT